MWSFNLDSLYFFKLLCLCSLSILKLTPLLKFTLSALRYYDWNANLTHFAKKLKAYLARIKWNSDLSLLSHFLLGECVCDFELSKDFWPLAVYKYFGVPPLFWIIQLFNIFSQSLLAFQSWKDLLEKKSVIHHSFTGTNKRSKDPSPEMTR